MYGNTLRNGAYLTQQLMLMKVLKTSGVKTDKIVRPHSGKIACMSAKFVYGRYLAKYTEKFTTHLRQAAATGLRYSATESF